MPYVEKAWTAKYTTIGNPVKARNRGGAQKVLAGAFGQMTTRTIISAVQTPVIAKRRAMIGVKVRIIEVVQ